MFLYWNKKKLLYRSPVFYYGTTLYTVFQAAGLYCLSIILTAEKQQRVHSVVKQPWQAVIKHLIIAELFC